MSVHFSPNQPTVQNSAAANMGGDEDAYLFIKVDTANGQFVPATAAGDVYVGVSRAPAATNKAGASMSVAQTGMVTVRSHGAFAIGDSLVPAAGGKAAKKGSAQAPTDRCIALEAATAADQTVLAILR